MEDYGLTDEDFKGTGDQFDVGYLEQIPSDQSQPSDLARQSLYVKFDPLVGSNSPRKDDDIVLPSQVEHNEVDVLLQTNTDSSTLIEIDGGNGNHLKSDVDIQALPSSTELIYSEDEVTQVLEEIKKTESELEMSKYDEEVTTLQQELHEAQEMVSQLKSGKGGKGIFKQFYHLDVSQLENQLQELKALSTKHEKLETVVVTQHEKRKTGIMSHQNETVTAEKSMLSLERSFLDLVQRYSSLRDQSSDLKNHQAQLSEEIVNLESECQKISEEYSKLVEEQMALVDKGNTSYDSLQREISSSMAVERVTTKKLELRVVTLTSEQQNKMGDKEQLTKICDNLLQELNKS